MSIKTSNDIKNEFLKSKIGITGILILLVLITISVFAVVSTPSSTFQDWNNPEKWITYPKTSVPSWINLFILEKIPEHKIFESENITAELNNFTDIPSGLITIISSNGESEYSNVKSNIKSLGKSSNS